MKRKALAIVLITIVALSVTAWFFYSQISELQNQIGELQAQNSEQQEQNSYLQNQINELLNETYERSPLRITAFDWIEGFNPYAGLTFVNEVKVTVKNQGLNEISGITLTVQLVNNGTLLYNSAPFVTQIDSLHAGESREISGLIFWALLSTRPTHCVSTLTLGDVVLDKYTYSF